MPGAERTIRFCVNNASTLVERQQLIDAGCEMRDCLGRCGPCFERRFIAVGTRIIEGDNYETILREASRTASEAAGSEDHCDNG